MRFEELFPDIGIETKEVEFKGHCDEGSDEKAGELSQIKWLKTIAAFANGDGGDLFVGVEDKSHTIVAFDHAEADRQMNLIRREGRQRLVPSLFLDPVAIPVKGKEETRYIIQVHVAKSRNVPVMLKSHNAYCTYVRKFGATEIATPEEIRELVLNHEETSFDVLPTGEKYDPNDFKLIKEEYKHNHNGEILLDKTLQLRGFFSSEGNLSQGALLFKDDYDGDKTRLSIAKWPGFDRGSDSLLFLKRLSGPITKVIHEASEIVSSISINGIQKTPEGERKLFSYPSRSVFEGIANAFAHRNYWKIGTQILIDIFPDRLEITSPGALLSGKELKMEKKIANIMPQHRNRLLADVLSLLGVTQGIGTGFDRIAKDYDGSDDAHQPFVNSTDESFTLVLPDLAYDRGVLGKHEEFPEIYLERGNLSGRDMKILSYCYNEKRSVSQIADVLGVSVSSYLKGTVIGGLVSKGYLLETSTKPMLLLSNRDIVKLKP